MDDTVEVPLSAREVQLALVEYAARKLGITCSYEHHVKIGGIWIVGDEQPVTVTINPLPNVVKLERPDHE